MKGSVVYFSLEEAIICIYIYIYIYTHTHTHVRIHVKHKSHLDLN
jgi:hypothetical protein